MRPLIGITSSFDDQGRIVIPGEYAHAVEAAGGLAVVLPSGPPETAGDIVGHVRGLVLAGGVDIDPAFFGEDPIPGLGVITPERDAFELALTRAALDGGCPVLAVCRGVQVLNVAAGGDLYQDIYSQMPKAIKHRQDAPRWYGSHLVRVRPGSLLHAVLGEVEARVNSFHHQAVRRLAPGFSAVAWSGDGVIEAMEAIEANGFALGVQWHPELMWRRSPLQLRLFKALVEAAQKRGTVGGHP